MNNLKVKFLLFLDIPLLDPGLSFHSEKKEVKRVFCAFCSERALQRLHCLNLWWSLSLLPSFPNTHLKPSKCYLFATLLTEIVQIAWERMVNHSYMTSCFWQQVPLVPFLEPFGLCFMYFCGLKCSINLFETFRASLCISLTQLCDYLLDWEGPELTTHFQPGLQLLYQLLYHFTSQLLINFPY